MGNAVTLLTDEDLEHGDSRGTMRSWPACAHTTRAGVKHGRARGCSRMSRTAARWSSQYNTTGDLVTDELGPYPF